jgi:hypothetical protein
VLFVDLPLRLASESHLVEFSNLLLTEWAKGSVRRRWAAPRKDFSFSLSADLSADYLADHYHPAQIRDRCISSAYTALLLRPVWRVRSCLKVPRQAEKVRAERSSLESINTAPNVAKTRRGQVGNWPTSVAIEPSISCTYSPTDGSHLKPKRRSNALLACSNFIRRS